MLLKIKKNYQELKKAIIENNSLSKNHSLFSINEIYRDQLDKSAQNNEKNIALRKIIVEIDNHIDQLENQLASYRIQLSNTATSNLISHSSLEAQKKALTAQYLMNAKQEDSQLKSQIAELETSLSVGKDQIRNDSLYSPDSGVLHLNKEIIGWSSIPEGTLIAEIYPNIEDENKIHASTYLSSRDISSIQIDDEVRFRILVDGKIYGQELHGEIIEIDSAPTRTEQGNVYQIITEYTIEEEKKNKIRYGLEGEILIKTGESTFLKYYISKLFNN